MSNSTYFEQAIANIKLPVGLHWYGIGGQIVFPIISSTGTLTSGLQAIVFQSLDAYSLDYGDFGPSRNVLVEKNGGRWVNVVANATDGALAISNKINAAIAALEA